MQIHLRDFRAVGALALIHVFFISHAIASLGGSIDSIESDRKAFEGKLRSLTTTDSQKKYTVHEISRDGTQIFEYALPNGTVFAVSWRGPTQPDLTVLLGDYYQEYQDKLSSLNRASSDGRTAQRRGRSARVIRSKNMVIERSGHMRDIRGKAYLPKLMPKDVKPEDLHS
ncbi:MAG: DUF2844 domain-containing protein [Bdellovibrionia bacterium]